VDFNDGVRFITLLNAVFDDHRDSDISKWMKALQNYTPKPTKMVERLVRNTH
jgi:hypothetical protein